MLFVLALLATLVAGWVVSPSTCSALSCGVVVGLATLTVWAGSWAVFFALERKRVPETVVVRQGMAALRRASVLAAVFVCAVVLMHMGWWRWWVGAFLVGVAILVGGWNTHIRNT